MHKKLLHLVDTYHAEMITVVAVFGMVGSLYFSNYGDPVLNMATGSLFPLSGGLAPCLLCWWARIFLYPLAFIAPVAALLRDKAYTYYALILSTVGAGITGFHTYLQLTATPFTPCRAMISCTEKQVEYFGFITIPMLAFVAFVLLVFISGRVVYTFRKGSV